MKKAQVSMEYVMVVAIALIMIFPIIIIYTMETNSFSDRLQMQQAQQITRKIVDTSESVYYLGYPSRMTIKVYMPHNVEFIGFDNKEVVFRMNFSGFSNDIISLSTVNITGDISTSAGLRNILVETLPNNMVNITDS